MSKITPRDIHDPFRVPQVAEFEIDGKQYVAGYPEELAEWELRRFMAWQFEKRLEELTETWIEQYDKEREG